MHRLYTLNAEGAHIGPTNIGKMKKRVAVVVEIQAQLGVYHAVLNRVKHLREVANYDIDVFLICIYDGFIMRWLRGCKPQLSLPQSFTDQGVPMTTCRVKRSWRNAIAHRLWGGAPKQLTAQLSLLAHRLNNYQLISAHDRIAGLVAQEASRLYNVPYFITWHGSSIHTDPANDAMVRLETMELLHKATGHFFVSQNLLACARQLCPNLEGVVLPNGASSLFYRYSAKKRAELRHRFGIKKDEKVVAYVGRFAPIKNTTLLPAIFCAIQEKCDGALKFWTVGDGPQHHAVEKMLQNEKIDCKMWGQQPASHMPNFMNCIDLLVLPSLKEGQPLVCLEAMACGACVVATDVGGTAECIGQDNVIALDEHLVEGMAQRAITLLGGKARQEPIPKCDGVTTAQKENKIYQQYL